MEQLTIRVPREHLVKLREIAKIFGLKKSDIARLAIKEYVEAGPKNSLINLFNRSSRLIGVVQSGIPDLGKNHRKHLTKKLKCQGP